MHVLHSHQPAECGLKPRRFLRTRCARAILLVSLFAAPATASEEEIQVAIAPPTTHGNAKLPSHRTSDALAPGRFGRGRVQLSLAGGYATSIYQNGHNNDASEYASTGLSASIGLTDPVALDSIFGGNLDLQVEGSFLFASQPSPGRAGGGGLLLRWNFLSSQKFVPFFNFGASLIYADLDLPLQRDGLNFLLQAGLGTHVFISPNQTISAEWRYQHISNAKTQLPNFGVDAGAFMIGTTFFYD